MSHATVDVSTRGGAVWLTLNRPQSLNALDEQMIEELAAAVDTAIERRPVAIVVTGRGRAFCAGADLKWARTAFAHGADAPTRCALDRLNRMFNLLEDGPIPTLAAVNGVCVAGGCELLLAVDLAVAAQSATFGDAHANYGLLPGGGGSARLPRVVGLRRAKRLLMLGEMLPAVEALAMGLVNWVVPDDQLVARTDEVVAALAARAPRGLAAMKHLANLTQHTSLAGGLEIERTTFYDHLASCQEVREGLAAFQAKRRPNFRDPTEPATTGTSQA
jgi:enoyl-CoA hydratase